jgi:TolB-like protein
MIKLEGSWRLRQLARVIFMPTGTSSTTGRGAVFLSYAREDTAAAGNIARTLREAGVEVWFDMSELRGGDVWDQKIRRQIKECALFIAVISANTQARAEGYFRREWKTAVDRTHDMSESRAFIVPVLVDDTSESAADVPEQFLRAHCTRLPGGASTSQFVEQVQRLLRAPRPQDGSAGAAQHVPAPPAPTLSRFRLRAIVLGASLLALLVTGYFWMTRPAATSAPSAEAAAGDHQPGPAQTVANDKSIAVLPFVDMSPGKDQEYMSDGLAEELLNLLAKIPALQVTSRTSAFSFKGKNVDVPMIAQRLHVAHVLEGSVRKSGTRLRITVQLIDARTDTHVWSDTYDRAEDDIFAVQDEIAAAVVAQLKVSLLGAAPKARAVEPKAYALSLRARQVGRLGTAAGHEQAIALYQEALAIDPAYAEPWVGLATNYLSQANKGLQPIDQCYRLAREAINKALAIDPDYAPAYRSLSRIASDYDGDLAAAAHHLEHALELEPTSLETMSTASALAQSLGRLDRATALDEYAVARDPLSATRHGSLAYDYVRSGRLDEGIAHYRTALSLAPGRVGTQYNIGETMLRQGNAVAALAAMQQEAEESWRLMGVAMAQHDLGRPAASDAALNQLIKKYEEDVAYNIAYVVAYRGETDRAFEWLDKAVAYHDTGLVEIADDPMFANIHSDPRWLPFLRKLGKAPEQLAAIKFDVKVPGR